MAGEASRIHWREWSNKAFEEAEREDKLILLSIGASWCHWCHVMDRTTFSDPDVTELLNERFIPIKVDADKRPDVQDRYLLGGWPTTAFLLPDGRILTGTTFMPPDSMRRKLLEVDDLYREQKSVVTMHVTSMAAEAEADRSETEAVHGTLDFGIIQRVQETLKKDFDRVHGGFGSEPKFTYPDAVRFAFLQYRKTGDREMLEMAEKALESMLKLSDPVWGGFYRYAVNPDWTKPHYEKLLYVQAGVMDNYLEAYQVTGDDRYGETAAGIKAYMERFLADPNGGFYGSQDADLRRDNGAGFVPGEDYYSRDEVARLELGIPFIDKSIYTDWNAMAVSAYLRLYAAMGDEHAREFALTTIDRLLRENMVDGRMCHYTDGQPQMPGILSDQVYFAQALIDAYQTTGDRKYLEHAESLVAFMLSELQDVVDGGFYFQMFDPKAKGELLERHKPFDENVASAMLLTLMYYLTGYESFSEQAERTLKSTAYPQLTDTIIGVGYARALDLFMNHPVHIVVVGDRDDEETQAMVETALHTYEPRKIVQVLDPEEDGLTVGDVTYQSEEEPVAYVCVQKVCSPPARGNKELVLLLNDVIAAPVRVR